MISVLLASLRFIGIDFVFYNLRRKLDESDVSV